MSEIKISVIIPTYKGSKILGDTIRSLREQRHLIPQDYEIIVVDNSSSEEVSNIVEKEKGLIPLIRYVEESNLGLHNVRHRGAKEAKANILLYIDDDIIADSNLLFEIIKCYDDTEVGCVGGKILPKWEVEPPQWLNLFPKGYLSILDDKEGPKAVQWLYGCNFSIQKGLLFEIGGFNPDAFGEKKMWWYRGDGEIGLLKKVHHTGKKIIYNPKAIVWHVIPQSRLKIDYFKERAFKSGIEASYSNYRYFDQFSKLRFFLQPLISGGFYCIRLSQGIFLRDLRAKVEVSYFKARCLYELRLLMDKKLKEFAKRESYMTSEAKSVAIITTHEWVGISTPVINTANYLAQQGYEVDVYLSNVDSETYITPEITNKANLICAHDRVKIVLLNDIFFYNRVFLKKKKYLFIIGFDIGGLVRAGIVGILSKTPFIYHSLEFLEYTLCRFNKLKFIEFLLCKFLERFFSKRATLVFTQDSLRANFLAKDLKIPEEKIKIVYNSPLGEIVTQKESYFHEKFNIPREKKIALVTGSLGIAHGTEDIVLSVKYWPQDFVLVLHGWLDNYVERVFKTEMEKYPKRIFLSTDLLPHSKKNIIFQSVDVGFVYFKPINNNFKYAAGSSGKFYDFIRNGKPVIGNNIPGMDDLLEGNGCGIVINDLNEIDKALTKIKMNYELYSKNAYNSYSKYEFGSCYKKMLDEVMNSNLKPAHRN